MVSLVAGEERTGPLAVGDLFLEKYEVLEQLGRGGHGFVYRARHRFLQHQVALKLLYRAQGVTTEMLHRGIIEAQIQHKVIHPGITAAEDIGITADGVLYIVMELMVGRSLRDVLVEAGRLGILEALRIGALIADALQAAHDLGVVHRDLKPDNIFITFGNQPKVFDFGIAKVHDARVIKTGKNVILGTVHYMSPEQLTTKVVTPRTDVFALAVILFEAIIGFPPTVLALGARAVDMREVARMIVMERPKRLDACDPTVPAYVASLIARGLANMPEQRFESANAFGRALRECAAALEAELLAAGKSLPSRDLSRPARARSGVERVEKSSALPATTTFDTVPVSRPFFFGGVPSGIVAQPEDTLTLMSPSPSRYVTHTAPLAETPPRAALVLRAPPQKTPLIASEPAQEPARARTPKPPKPNVLDRLSLAGVVITGVLLGLIAVGAFSFRQQRPQPAKGRETIRSAAPTAAPQPPQVKPLSQPQPRPPKTLPVEPRTERPAATLPSTSVLPPSAAEPSPSTPPRSAPRPRTESIF